MCRVVSFEGTSYLYRFVVCLCTVGCAGLYVYVVSLSIQLRCVSICSEHMWVCTMCRAPAAAALAAACLLTQSHALMTFHTPPRVIHAYTAANLHRGQSLHLPTEISLKSCPRPCWVIFSMQSRWQEKTCSNGQQQCRRG
jgi:hypothetical protein